MVEWRRRKKSSEPEQVAPMHFFRPATVMKLAFLPVMLISLLTLAACVHAVRSEVPKLPVTVRGVVRGPSGPVAGALVMLQGTETRATSDADGSFVLHGEGLGSSQSVTVTAWADEHFIGAMALDPRSPPPSVEVKLQPLFDRDNHEYSWFEFNGKSGSESCALCHREVAEFKADAHSKSASNIRFLNLYRGTNSQGKRGQPTRMIAENKALPPDPSLPDYGPGFRLDNGDRPGNCATCHAPMAAKIDTQNGCAWSGCHSPTTADRAESAKATKYTIRGVSPVGMVGAAEEGVGCEFCHVVKGVRIDPATQRPFTDAPGILSMELRRPPEGHKVFFGTIPDANREEVTYSPAMASSQFCAACHFGVMGGVVSNMKMVGGVTVYNSYGEWLDSPWSDPQTGKTCQDCHMPATDAAYSVPPEFGGVARPGYRYHDHKMASTDSRTLMLSALTLKQQAERDGDRLLVSVSVANENTGHAVPTDAPIRSVILLVEAFDSAGTPLRVQSAPLLQEWAGDYARRAGRGYAKILKDLWTGESPTAAYWRQVEIQEDTRLLPMMTDTSEYVFDAPTGAATIKTRLIYRPAFYALAQQKGWPNEDIVMQESTTEIP
jgi:hypothetical protein